MVTFLDECWDGGERRVGAMVWRHHTRLHDLDTAPRPMPHLAVMTPAGLACLDCPATGGNKQPGRYWARTGEPPLVTVTPSLDVNPGGDPHWHGFITGGVLV